MKGCKAIRIEARVRNNVLYQAIYSLYPSVAEFSRVSGFNQAQVGVFLNLKTSPTAQDGMYKDVCVRLANFFAIPVEELFPLDIYKISQNKIVREFDIGELCLLPSQIPALPSPDGALLKKELCTKLLEALDESLTPRERLVLKLHFGVDDMEVAEFERQSGIDVGNGLTQTKIAEWDGCSNGRIGQIVQKALRKLRHPKRSRTFKTCLGEL